MSSESIQGQDCSVSKETAELARLTLKGIASFPECPVQELQMGLVGESFCTALRQTSGPFSCSLHPY